MLSRRQVLALAGAGGAGAGVYGVLGGSACALGPPPAAGNDWPLPRRDAGNTAAAPPAAAPDPADLSVRWEHTSSRPLGRPAVADGTVFCVESDRTSSPPSDAELVALSASTGAERWRRSFALDTGPLFEKAADPVVADGTVYVVASAAVPSAADGVGRRLYAVDADSGEVRWTRTAEGAFAVHTAGRGVVVVGESGDVRALGADVGERCARYRTGGPFPEWLLTDALLAGPPAFDGDRTYLVVRKETNSPRGECRAVALDIADGSYAWTSEWVEHRGRATGPVLVGDDVVFTAGTSVRAVDAATGASKWTASELDPESQSDPGPTTLASDGETLSVWSLSRDVCYGLDASTGERRWRRGSVFQATTVGGDVVYGVDTGPDAPDAPERALVALDLDSGEVRGRTLLTGSIRDVVVAAGRTLVRGVEEREGRDLSVLRAFA